MNSEMHSYATAIADKLNSMDAEEIREYFRENALDVDYTVNLCGSDIILIGLEIWITVGGPTVWVSTRDGQVHATHGDDKGRASLTTQTEARIHNFYEEVFFSSI